MISDIARFQPQAWALVSRSFANERFAGTYLLHGRQGFGHWPFAISIAALLNCERPERSDTNEQVIVPCGQCRNCRHVFSLSFQGLLYALPLPPHKNAEQAVDLTSEILKLKREEQVKLKSLNERYNGPIPKPTKGKQPIVRKDLLLEWWNRLAVMEQELASRREGGKLAAEAQYNYGREGRVAPEISGSEKKRRKDSKR